MGWSLCRVDPSDTLDDEVAVEGMEGWCTACKVRQETKHLRLARYTSMVDAARPWVPA